MGWGLRVSEVWPTGYRRGHARRSFQIDGRADLATHTQASDEAGPASGYTPEFLNSKAGEILSTSPQQTPTFFVIYIVHAVG